MKERSYSKSGAHDFVGRSLDALGMDPDRKSELMDAAGRVRRTYFENRAGVWGAAANEIRQQVSRSSRLAAETRMLHLTPAQVSALIEKRSHRTRSVLRSRIVTVVSTLGGASVAASTPTPDLIASLLATLEAGPVEEAASRYWLTLSVLGGRLATPEEVTTAVRRARTRGPLAAVATLLGARLRGPRDLVDVTVVVGEVLVDVHTTARSDVLTGIQRVTHQSVRRWHRDHQLRLIGWDPGFHGIRALTVAEERAALDGALLAPEDRARSAYEELTTVLVPWRCTYVLPELVTDLPRSDRIQAIARFSMSRTGTIGYDCVPISSGETVGPGTASGFVRTLAGIAHVDRVAAISDAAAEEYRGWRRMLTGAGLTGPEIAAIPLAVEAPVVGPESLAVARAALGNEASPVVLCVGSHEPRKNHLAVIHAAELLWRDGVDFTLVFVGGNSWKDDGFTAKVDELLAAGRPVRVLRAAGDALLWGAYGLSRCTIFPSLNEGFGLPVAESLAIGTPVITSNFGSMAEIAAGGGALLVDPRDDHAIAEALRRLLTDDGLHARLSTEAAGRTPRSWDAYADEVWRHLVDGD